MEGNPGAPYRYNPKKVSPLVKKYLAKARKINSASQSYGGSTGGRKSIDRGSGLSILGQRSAEQASKKAVFSKLGSGDLGGRSESWRARKELQNPDLGT